MSKYNNVSVEAYASGTTRIADPKGEIRKIQGLNYRTFYPGGLYGDASFFVPRSVIDWWELNGATRLTFRNDLRQCYEGYISNLQSDVDETEQGTQVSLLGATGHILMNWPLRKRWADDRITDDVWRYQTDPAAYTGAEKCNIDRNERLRFTPKAEAWTSGQYVAVLYTMPVGETVKRLTYDYALAEAGQQWQISAWRGNAIGAFNTMSNVSGDTYAVGTTTVIAASGTGSIDVTLVIPSRYLLLMFSAGANQTPTSDGTYYGEFTNVKVYSELGLINMEEIAKDIVGAVTTLNSDTRFIFAAGTALSLVPFLADDFQSAADTLEQVVSQGDGVYGRWAWYCVGSERAYVPDGKPLLVVTGYPATSDYEYLLSLDDENLVPPLSISQDFDSIANWIAVQYTDTLNFRQWVTPDDAATLKDDTSINAYGRRGYVITLPGTSTSTIATAVGQRYLATFKDPQYRVTSPITVAGYIRGKGGLIVPASEMRAGHRLRIENYAQDVTGSNQGLTFVITATSYDNDSETCQLTTGVPEAPLLLRHTRTLSGGGPQQPPIGIQPVTRTITDAMLRKMGLTRAQWARMTPKQRRAAKKRAGL